MLKSESRRPGSIALHRCLGCGVVLDDDIVGMRCDECRPAISPIARAAGEATRQREAAIKALEREMHDLEHAIRSVEGRMKKWR